MATIAPSDGGLSDAIESAVFPPYEIPQIPVRPVHHGWAAIHASASKPSIFSAGRERRLRDALRFAVAAKIDAETREAPPRQRELAELDDAAAAHPVLEVRRVLNERRKRSRTVGQVQVRAEVDAVPHRDPEVALDSNAGAHQSRQTRLSGRSTRITRSSWIRSQCGRTSSSSRYFRRIASVRSRTVSSSTIWTVPYAVT